MAAKQRLWITGAGGLLGNSFAQSAPVIGSEWDAVALTRRDLDLLDFSAVERRFHEERPNLVIHCAAMSKSPACEQNPALAHRTNVEATRCLASLAADTPFVFISTDLVFDGRKGSYVETDRVNPLGVYAETKVAAEKIVMANQRHTIVRCSLIAGRSPGGDRSFVEEMRQAWTAGKAPRLFVDEYRCPIPASAIVQAVWELIKQERPGLYHLAGAERLSRYEIGQLLAECWPELQPQIERASIRDYKGAPRPPDTSMNCAKIQELISFPLPKFSDWVRGGAGEVSR